MTRFQSEECLNVKSSSASWFCLADAVTATRSNGRLSQTASCLPTILCSQHLSVKLSQRRRSSDKQAKAFYVLFLLFRSGFRLLKIFSSVSSSRFIFCGKSATSDGRNFCTEERRARHPSSCWVECPVVATAGLRSEAKANLLFMNAVKEQGWEVMTSAGIPA